MAVDEAVTAADESRQQASVSGSNQAFPLAICLSPTYTDAAPEQLLAMLPWLRTAMQAAGVAGPYLVGYPVTAGDTPAEQHDDFLLQPFVESVASRSVLVQTAAAWLNAYELLRAHGAGAGLLLGTEATSLQPASVGALVRAVLQGGGDGPGADLAVPRYDLPSSQGLLNAAMLSPVSRALFNVDVRFPLPLEFACSARMAERMAGAAQRFTAAGQGDAVVWPVGEAAVAGFSFAEVAVGPREVPAVNDDLQSILGRIAGSMFLDVESKAAFWQRTRPAAPIARVGALPAPVPQEATAADEIAGLIESFRNGYNNLHELWSLVLPPNTLVALKRLSTAPAESFRLPDAVWVRTVYDFVLAHRLRTIARNHLIGAFAPLYLAWVASHLVQADGTEHAEQLARAFEADKPYLVSRWRWPDRFNP